MQRDMRKAQRARDVLRAIPIDDLIARVGAAGDLYMNATLPMGDGTQTPDEFVRAQSASTGLPERMCRANMKKNAFVLGEMRSILDVAHARALARRAHDRYGEERGVPISYQAQSPVLGLVLPSNSPGVHTLWLPIIPMQIGLVLKPGPQEPWTPYRMAAAFFEAGVPREAISIYPGRRDVGAAVLDSVRPQPDLRRHRDGRSLSRQPACAGARPRILEDSARRRRRSTLGRVSRHDGRERVHQQRARLHQRSGIWASRHTREIAERSRSGWRPIRPLPPDHPGRGLAAFTVPGVADAISQSIDADLAGAGVTDVTAKYRDGGARVKDGPRRLSAADGHPLRLARSASREEGVHVPVRHRRRVPRVEDARGDRADARLHGHHRQEALRRRLLDAVHIDRLNFGPVPTTRSTGCSRTKATSSISCSARGRFRQAALAV